MLFGNAAIRASDMASTELLIYGPTYDLKAIAIAMSCAIVSFNSTLSINQ